MHVMVAGFIMHYDLNEKNKTLLSVSVWFGISLNISDIDIYIVLYFK